MIQFNLLPKVKLDYVRASHNKRTVAFVATIVTVAALAILIILFVAVQVVQRKYSRDLSTDIQQEISKLNGVQDLNKVLTIQNQLNSLTALHDQKPVTSRLFVYIKQVTPAKIGITDLKIDFVAHTIEITGKADALSTVNTYVDTLKFTTYKTQSSETPYAFSGVVLKDFGKDKDGATYDVTLNFDPVIFAGDNNVSLIVPPGKITTRSETEKPTELFQATEGAQ